MKTAYSFNFSIQTDILPPRPSESFFHPQMLFLKLPKENHNVNRYQITINGYTEYYVYSTEYKWPKHLEPGTNYTIQIVAYCWWSESYRRTYTYNGYIETQRKYNAFYILPCSIFSKRHCKKKHYFVKTVNENNNMMISWWFICYESVLNNVYRNYQVVILWWAFNKKKITYFFFKKKKWFYFCM